MSTGHHDVRETADAYELKIQSLTLEEKSVKNF